MELTAKGAARLVLPSGIVATMGPQLKALASVAGDELEDWQYQLLCIMLAVRSDGRWAARNFGASIPRQAGKTFMARWLAVYRAALDPKTRIVWTAQHFSVITDTFQSMEAMVTRPAMASLVDPVHGIGRASGKEEIRFKNGSRIYFRARENGALRGLQNISLIIVDEAQILSEAALASMLPTQNRAVNPQTIFIGTPPGPRDMGEVFTRHRSQSLAGRAPHDCWVEYSADSNADPLDRKQWAKANPSYPSHTTDDAILNLHDELAPDDFRREALGIWDEARTRAAIDIGKWSDGTVDARRDGGRVAFGLDMSPDRQTLTIGAVMLYDDGTAHVETAERRRTAEAGTEWAIQWLAARWPHTVAVAVDAQSPALPLVTDLQSAGVRVTVTNTRSLSEACGRFQDMIAAGKLTHLSEDRQTALWQAVRRATSRPIGKSGQFAWGRPDQDTDISPLVAVTVALQAVCTSRRNPNGPKQTLIV